MVADEPARHLERRSAGIHAAAALSEPVHEPAALGGGTFCQNAKAHGHALAATQKQGKSISPEGRIRIALPRSRLHMRDQAAVSGNGGGPDIGFCISGNTCGEAADPADQGLSYRRAEPVQGCDSGGRGLGPCSEMFVARPRPVFGWRVVAVITGQVQLVEVQQEIPPVHLQIAELNSRGDLEYSQVRLVIRITKPAARPGGGAQAAQPGPHPGRRQILDAAVVFVAAAGLADMTDSRVTDSANTRRQIACPESLSRNAI